MYSLAISLPSSCAAFSQAFAVSYDATQLLISVTYLGHFRSDHVALNELITTAIFIRTQKVLQ